jgi:hypothetical protein
VGWRQQDGSSDRPRLAHRPGYRWSVVIRVVLLAVLLAASLFFRFSGMTLLELWLARLALLGGIVVGTTWLARNPPPTQSGL